VKFSKDYVLFCHITTMIPGDKHGDLLEEKGGNAFPFLAFMDAEGSVIAIHTEDRTPAEFAKTGEKAKSFVQAKVKAEKGDPEAKIDFVILQLSFGQIKSEDARKKVTEAGTPTKDQQAKLEAELLNAWVSETVKGVDNQDELKPVAKKFYDLYKAGKPGPTGTQAMQAYYILALGAADELKDVEGFGAILKILKDKFGAVEGAQLFFKAKEKRLEELRAEKK
jgi:hypothetical protein